MALLIPFLMNTLIYLHCEYLLKWFLDVTLDWVYCFLWHQTEKNMYVIRALLYCDIIIWTVQILDWVVELQHGNTCCTCIRVYLPMAWSYMFRYALPNGTKRKKKESWSINCCIQSDIFRIRCSGTRCFLSR